MSLRERKRLAPAARRHRVEAGAPERPREGSGDRRLVLHEQDACAAWLSTVRTSTAGWLGVNLLAGIRVNYGDRRRPGHDSAASISSSGGPSPTTRAMSSTSNTPGAISAQSPCALHAPSSILGNASHRCCSLFGDRGNRDPPARGGGQSASDRGRPTSSAATGTPARVNRASKSRASGSPSIAMRSASAAWPTYWMRTPYWSLQKLGSGVGSRIDGRASRAPPRRPGAPRPPSARSARGVPAPGRRRARRRPPRRRRRRAVRPAGSTGTPPSSSPLPSSQLVSRLDADADEDVIAGDAAPVRQLERPDAPAAADPVDARRRAGPSTPSDAVQLGEPARRGRRRARPQAGRPAPRRSSPPRRAPSAEDAASRPMKPAPTTASRTPGASAPREAPARRRACAAARTLS